MKRFFNLLFGFIRMSFNCIFNFGSLKLQGVKFYLGKGAKIEISKKGKIVLGKKIWIDRNSTVAASSGVLVIGNNNFFSTNCRIVSLGLIEIGSNNLFGPNTVIVDHNHKYSDINQLICRQGYEVKNITIGSNIWVGANVTICAGVKICDNVVIAANSVVTKDIIQPGVYAGVPAKFIKNL